MTIQRAGEHWWLDVGQQRLEFRSDGRGQISLIEPTGVRRVVSPRWAELGRTPGPLLGWGLRQGRISAGLSLTRTRPSQSAQAASN
ncbi:MAG: hypothetical protein ACO24E_08290 [Vulcanococcus sp.]